jgi:diguanylate cyclase (GGDEF)-like protein
MSAFFEPLRVLVLAETPEWAERLRESLRGVERPCRLIYAPSWEAAGGLFAEHCAGLLLATPGCLPAPGCCAWPSVLLLEAEPAEPPLNGNDWLVRGSLCVEVLRRCLRYVQQRQLNLSLVRSAEQDALTGLANRQAFYRVLHARLAERPGAALTLAHLGLDNFRHVNDVLGHEAGDQLIVQVVARLQAQLQPGDQLARLGSDEFALLLDTHSDPSHAMRVAERIATALAEPYWLDNESLLIGCSLGLANAHPELGADPLMWQAHNAMRQAKRADGCSPQLYAEGFNSGARSQIELEKELRRALRCDELEVHYQPRLCLSSGRIVGLEALVRWRHPERGLLAPNDFIPLAEASGLIVPLGYWVISRALRDMQWLRERGVPALHMAINLSFRQFQDSQLCVTLQRLIEEQGVDARWLEFELTETAVMRHSAPVQQTIAALQALGVRFSLDDFGTGFSSFVHLQRLPIALLKIDRSFVSDLEVCPQSRHLVRAMINLGHELNLEVVAEGAETAEQLSLLRQMGCDQVQGYLISKPLPRAELAQFLTVGVRQPVLAALSE